MAKTGNESGQTEQRSVGPSTEASGAAQAPKSPQQISAEVKAAKKFRATNNIVIGSATVSRGEVSRERLEQAFKASLAANVPQAERAEKVERLILAQVASGALIVTGD